MANSVKVRLSQKQISFRKTSAQTILVKRLFAIRIILQQRRAEIKPEVDNLKLRKYSENNILHHIFCNYRKTGNRYFIEIRN